jgi:site-specific recombinase XerD
MKRKRNRQNSRPRRVLRLLDLEHARTAVLNSLSSPESQRGYRHAIDEFVDWYCSEPRLAFNRIVVLRYRSHLEARRLAPATINLRLGAVRRLAYEAVDCGLLSADVAAGIRRVKGLKKNGVRMGNWLTDEQARSLWQSPDRARMKGKRDRALLALLLACGLRRHEAANLRVEDLQQREDHWAIVDLVGKGRHVRTVPMPDWVHMELLAWLSSASINRGKIFRRVSRTGRVLGEGISEKAIWHVVRSSASKVGVPALAPHDLRRTCARLCRNAGGELDQIQLLLGHVSIQTTEQYLGSRQRIRSAVNDRIGIEPGSYEISDSQESFFSPETTSVGSYPDLDDGVRPKQSRRDGFGAAVANAGGSAASVEVARLGRNGTPPCQGVHLRPEVQGEIGSLQREGERRARELFERHFGRKD